MVAHANRRSHHPRALTKDLILQYYVPKYFGALRKRGCKKIVYIDAFAGPGKYEDESEGSPLHVLKIAQNLKEIISDPYYKENLIFIFVEEKLDTFKALQKSINPFQEKGFKIACLQADGSNVVKDIINYIRTEISDPSQIGVFVYLDPWGLKGVEKEIVMEVLSLRQFLTPAEVLLRFPPYLVCRYYKNSKFGPDWIKRRLGLSQKELEEVINMPEKTERHDLILKTYAITIMQDHFNLTKHPLSGCAVETVGSGMPYYMLFFSESDAGVSHMSDAMAKAFIRRQIEIKIEKGGFFKETLQQEYFNKRGYFLYKKAVQKDGKNWPKYFKISSKELLPFKARKIQTREELLFFLLQDRIFAVSHYALEEALNNLGVQISEKKGLYAFLKWN